MTRPLIRRIAPRAICVRPARMGSAVGLAVPEADAGAREIDARADYQPKLGEWCSAYELQDEFEGQPEWVWVCVPLVSQ
jgi:hypothetical protein